MLSNCVLYTNHNDYVDEVVLKEIGLINNLTGRVGRVKQSNRVGWSCKGKGGKLEYPLLLMCLKV